MADSNVTDESGVEITASASKMPGGVSTFQPKISVVLKKNIGRSSAGEGVAASERFKGAAREIDLTPYLGADGMVMISHSVREPAGMFTITLADRMEAEQQESLYGLIEPMDVVEIRMARDMSRYASASEKSMPIIMRGFVSSVRRSQSMTTAGPHRNVVISGQDYGKILQIMRIIYLPGMVLGQDLLTPYNLFLNYGPEANAEMPIGDFVKDVMEKVVQKFIAKMRSSATGGEDAKSPVMDIKLDSTVTEGIVAPFGLQDWPGGTTYDLLKYFGDVGPWNELYVEDREDGPYLVYRPTPFHDLQGGMIQAGSEPATISIYDEELITLESERTDSNVANYYWVDAPRYSMVDPTLLQAAAAGGQMSPDPFLKDYANSSPNFYGVRAMQVQTQQGPRIDGQAEAGYQQGGERGIKLVNERVKAGMFVEIRRGSGDDLAAEIYAHQVTHTFTPFRDFTTSVAYDRGTGFVERIQRNRGASSPYLTEMTMREAYGG